MRWIFQIFEGVHLLIIKDSDGYREVILNLNEERMLILRKLGPPFEKIYQNAF